MSDAPNTAPLRRDEAITELRGLRDKAQGERQYWHGRFVALRGNRRAKFLYEEARMNYLRASITLNALNMLEGCHLPTSLYIGELPR